MNSQENTPYLVWDTHEILTAHAKHLIEIGEAEHQEIGYYRACADPYLLNDELECLSYSLTDKLNEINLGSHWYAETKNFGWLNLSGDKDFKAKSGKIFLLEILPKTHCNSVAILKITA